MSTREDVELYLLTIRRHEDRIRALHESTRGLGATNGSFLHSVGERSSKGLMAYGNGSYQGSVGMELGGLDKELIVEINAIKTVICEIATNLELLLFIKKQGVRFTNALHKELVEHIDSLTSMNDVCMYVPEALKELMWVRGTMEVLGILFRIANLNQEHTDISRLVAGHYNKSDQIVDFHLNMKLMLEAQDMIINSGGEVLISTIWALYYSGATMEMLECLDAIDRERICKEVKITHCKGWVSNAGLESQGDIKYRHHCWSVYCTMILYQSKLWRDSVLTIYALQSILSVTQILTAEEYRVLVSLKTVNYINHYIYNELLKGHDTESTAEKVKQYRYDGPFEFIISSRINIKSLQNEYLLPTMMPPVDGFTSQKVFLYLYALRRSVLTLAGLIPWYCRVVEKYRKDLKGSNNEETADNNGHIREGVFIDVYLESILDGVLEKDDTTESLIFDLLHQYDNLITGLETQSHIALYNDLLLLAKQDRMLLLYETDTPVPTFKEQCGDLGTFGTDDHFFKFTSINKNDGIAMVDVVGGTEIAPLIRLSCRARGMHIPEEDCRRNGHIYVFASLYKKVAQCPLSLYDISKFCWHLANEEERILRYHGNMFISALITSSS